MFKPLEKFNNIVVSGPQRSGTRIAAKIIANDTGKVYIDERDIDCHDFRLLEWHLQQGNVVIQCPGLCHLLHYITDVSTLVIVVRRPIEEIISSEHRHWSKEAEKIELLKYGCSNGIISRIKYDFWDKVQKAILSERAREVNYHSLSTHSLFIKDRKGFRWNQTQ
jgi:hypothetical protein